MNTAKEKGYAKINMFLDVLSRDGDYHVIDTVVATINLYDVVTVSKRRDNKVLVKTGGGLYWLPLKTENNNAYKAAVMFMETFNTKGVDITINKKIPVGGGLGGSSADVAATLVAMKKIFNVNEDLKPLADKLGSDVGFQMEGGFARLTGRGENIEFIDSDEKMYLVIATPKKGVSTKGCYEEFDRTPIAKCLFDGNFVKQKLADKSLTKDCFYNALYPAAIKLNPQVERVYGLIAALSPKAVAMSGSGSSVFGVFETKELCEWAKDKLKNEDVILNVTETLSKRELDKKPTVLNPFSVNQ